MFINQNNSINHSLSKEAFTNKELMLRISKYLKNNLNVSISFIERDSTNEMYRDNHFFIRLEKAI
jgi:LytS/YehU family sensor histidine kinase